VAAPENLQIKFHGENGANMTTRTSFTTRFCWILAVAAAISAGSASQARADAKVYQDAVRSTTWVLTKVAGKTSSGTGVLVDAEKKLVMTNFHVVGESRVAYIIFPEFKGETLTVEKKYYGENAGKLSFVGRVVAVDRKRDLALVQLEKLPEGAKAIKLSEKSASPGEEIQSIGNPGSSGALWVHTSGTVRSVYKKQFRTGSGEHEFKVVETQAPINTGDSGGPVVNGAGELVAIAQAFSPNGRMVSYSVDIDEVRGFMNGPWKPAPLPIGDILTTAELTFKQHESGHFEVSIKQDEKDKEAQTVFVTKEVEYYEKADVRKVWALAAILPKAPKFETTMKLLEQNGRTKLGSWNIERTEKGDHLILYCAKMDATASPDAVKSTVEYVAKLAALMKKELATPETTAQKASDGLDDWLK
jgi:serine protease Do